MAELPPLDSEDFAGFVREVHGFRPMLWQQRLLTDHAAQAEWPDVVKVPTGLGKTILVDVAVFALARQADREPNERTARTRTFVIVDRRLVVDDIYLHATTIADALAESEPGTVTGRVAAHLRHIAARPTSMPEPEAVPAPQRPLEVTRMRGGVTWAARWVMWPEQPTVVIGTVDQLGSRMLFRGYGVSRGSLPLDAALTATDALVILDEAHLADALRKTISELHELEATAARPVLPRRPPLLVAMSATPLPSTAPFVLQPEERTEDVARQRLEARKPVTLWEITDAPKRDPRGARNRMAAVLAVAAQRLLDHGPDVRVLGVVVNTVQTARAVFDLIRASGVDADLLIGRSREPDRELLAKRIRKRAGVARRTDSEPGDPYVVVATQTIEVGVNLDLDALVTEATSLDALTQRLGRLDRQGVRSAQGSHSPVLIVHVDGYHDDDPVYGPALERTWDWLTSLAQVHDMKGAAGPSRANLNGQVDLGPGSLDAMLDDDQRRPLVTDPPERPALFPREHLSAWARTSPKPRSDVDIAPFMRGRVDPQPSVQVCWRADVSAVDPERTVRHSLDLRPVLSAETVEVPLWEARRWLAGLESDGSPLADAPVMRMVDAPPDTGRPRMPVLRLDAQGEAHALQSPAALRPGDILVCPRTVGGLDAFGWAPDREDDVLDVADLCRSRTGVVIRAATATIGQFGEGPSSQAGSWLASVRLGLAASPPARLDHGVAALTSAWLEEQGAAGPRQGGGTAVAQALKECLKTAPFETVHEAHRIKLLDIIEEVQSDRWRLRIDVSDGAEDAPLQVVLRARPLTDAAQTSDQQQDADESTALSGRTVTLREHSSAVASSARASAARLGLPQMLVAAVELAAEAHDLGKVDRRFQQMLHGGDAFAADASSEPLAKSGMDSTDRAAFRRARIDSDWPDGMRHEALSVALLDAWLAEGRAEAADHELVRHLVAVHHGYMRPLLDPVEEPKLLDLTAKFRKQEVSVMADDIERYLIDWEAPGRVNRLVDRYGAWGLALLETIVRLADIRCSEAGT